MAELSSLSISLHLGVFFHVLFHSKALGRVDLSGAYFRRRGGDDGSGGYRSFVSPERGQWFTLRAGCCAFLTSLNTPFYFNTPIWFWEEGKCGNGIS
jgi:hypothetical protein